MKINGSQLMFFTELWDEYKKKLYLRMRKDCYTMDNIASFINGYSIVTNECFEYVMDKVYKNGDIFYTVMIDNCDKAIAILDTIVNNIHNTYITSNDWEKIGIKYAICLAKYYIKNVIFGDDTEVEELYMDIPDKDDPDSYDWEEHGLRRDRIWK